MGKKRRPNAPYKGNNNRTPTKKTTKISTEDDIYDEVDKFAQQADEINFEAEAYENTRLNDTRSVMKIAAEEETSSEIESSEDNQVLVSEDEEENARKNKKKDKKLDEKYQEWGRLAGKRKYHGTDVIPGEEDYETAVQEEEEAKFLQQKRIENLDAEDFIAGDDESGTNSENDEFWDEAGQKQKFQTAAKELAGLSLLPNSQILSKSNVSKLSKLSKKEKLQLIENESPELLALLPDLKNKLEKLKEIHSLLLECSKQDFKNEFIYIESKFHLFTNYCMNFGFYLYLKSRGKLSNDHPVIEQLLKLRTFIESQSSFESDFHSHLKKLKKFTKKAAVKDTASSSSEEEDEKNDSKVAETSSVDEPGDSDVEQAASSDEENFEIQEDMLDNLTEKVKSRRNKEERFMQQAEFEDMDDVRDFSTKPAVKTSSSKLNSVMNKLDVKKGSTNTEEDLPYTTWAKPSFLSKRPISQLDTQEEEEDDAPLEQNETHEEDDNFYKQAKNSKKIRKVEPKQIIYYDDYLKQNEKRGLSFQIEANKGLTRQRPKKMRNPRIRYKQKAEDANKKIKSLVPQIRDRTAPYQGEASGLRKLIKRSVKLN